MKRESAFKSMEKKSNTEFGTHIDPKSLLQSSVVSPKLVSIQEPRFCISVPPQEQLSPTFLISLAQKVSFTPSNSHTESEEIWSTWPRRELTSSQSSMMPESQTITDSWSVWSTVSSLTSPNQIRQESLPRTVTCT